MLAPVLGLQWATQPRSMNPILIGKSDLTLDCVATGATPVEIGVCIRKYVLSERMSGLMILQCTQYSNGFCFSQSMCGSTTTKPSTSPKKHNSTVFFSTIHCIFLSSLI